MVPNGDDRAKVALEHGAYGQSGATACSARRADGFFKTVSLCALQSNTFLLHRLARHRFRVGVEG